MSASDSTSASLPCTRCGESVPDGFDACWRCGTRVPESLLEREPEPALDPPLAVDRATARAWARAWVAQQPPTSLRVHMATGLIAAFLSLAFTTGLVDARGAVARRILTDPAFWRTLLLHAVVLGLYCAGLALWRRVRRPTSDRAPAT